MRNGALGRLEAAAALEAEGEASSVLAEVEVEAAGPVDGDAPGATGVTSLPASAEGVVSVVAVVVPGAPLETPGMVAVPPGATGVTPDSAVVWPPGLVWLELGVDEGVDGAGPLTLGGVLEPPKGRNDPPFSKVAMIPAMTARSARPMRRSGQLRRIQSMTHSLL